MPVVRQYFVPQATIANLKDVQKYLSNRGFMKVHPLVNAYRNWELGIILGDLHDRNVLLKKDTLFFIDTKFFISYNVDYIYNKGGKVTGEDLISKYNLWGKGIPVKFRNDNATYYTINPSLDKKTIFITDQNGAKRNKKIQDIAEVEGRKLIFEEGGKIKTTSNGSKGGIFIGPSHDNGGMPTIITGTGEKIEVEGNEPLLVPEVLKTKKRLRCTGKTKEVLSTINQMSGGSNFSKEQAHCEIIDDKKSGGKLIKKKRLKPITHISGNVVHAPAGSVVINKKSAAMQKKVVCEGTPGGMVSAINEIDGNGVKIQSGGSCRVINRKKSIIDSVSETPLKNEGGSVGESKHVYWTLPKVTPVHNKLGTQIIIEKQGEPTKHAHGEYQLWRVYMQSPDGEKYWNTPSLSYEKVLTRAEELKYTIESGYKVAELVQKMYSKQK